MAVGSADLLSQAQINAELEEVVRPRARSAPPSLDEGRRNRKRRNSQEQVNVSGGSKGAVPLSFSVSSGSPSAVPSSSAVSALASEQSLDIHVVPWADDQGQLAPRAMDVCEALASLTGFAALQDLKVKSRGSLFHVHGGRGQCKPCHFHGKAVFYNREPCRFEKNCKFCHEDEDHGVVVRDRSSAHGLIESAAICQGSSSVTAVAFAPFSTQRTTPDPVAG